MVILKYIEMYISELRINNFKKFERAKFNFDHGINVVRGANEQGKSTLLKAIIAALYIDPSSQKYKEMYKSWNKDVYPDIELDFFIGENLYAIIKNFNTKEVILRDILAKTDEKNLAVITRSIKDFTGIGDEGLLRATACINHEELTQLESGKRSLQEALQEISIGDGKVNILALLRDLNAKIDEMQVGLYHPAKNNGIIKRLQDNVDELSRELTSLQAKKNDLGNASDKLQSLQQELTQVENEITKYTSIVENYERKESVEKDLNVIEEKNKNISMDLTKVEELSDKILKAEEKLRILGGEELLHILDEKQADIIATNKAMQELQKEIALAKPARPMAVNVETKNNRSVVYITVSVIALVLVLIGIFSSKLFIFAGLVVVSVNLLLVLLSKEKRGDEEGEDEVALHGIAAKQNELTHMQTKLDGLLQECSLTSVDEYFSRRTQLIALYSDYTQMKVTIEALLRGKNL